MEFKTKNLSPLTNAKTELKSRYSDCLEDHASHASRFSKCQCRSDAPSIVVERIKKLILELWVKIALQSRIDIHCFRILIHRLRNEQKRTQEQFSLLADPCIVGRRRAATSAANLASGVACCTVAKSRVVES